MAALIILLAFCASTLGSVAQTTVGFGIALFLAPANFLILDPAEAVVCTLTSATLLSLTMLLVERDRLDLDRAVTVRLLAPAIPGVALGAALLGVIGKSYLQIGVALVVVGFLVSRARLGSGAIPDARQLFRLRSAAIPSGFVAGVLNGSVSTGGPALAIWLQAIGSRPDRMRHTLAVIFIGINLCSIAAVVALEAPTIDGDWIRAVVGGSIGVPVGFVLGRRIYRRMDERVFGAAVTVALLAVAGASAISGVGGL